MYLQRYILIIMKLKLLYSHVKLVVSNCSVYPASKSLMTIRHCYNMKHYTSNVLYNKYTSSVQYMMIYIIILYHNISLVIFIIYSLYIWCENRIYMVKKYFKITFLYFCINCINFINKFITFDNDLWNQQLVLSDKKM